MNRKKFIKSGLLFVPFIPNIIVRAASPVPFNPQIRTVVSGGGGSESIWKQQTTDNDNWGVGETTFSQKIKNVEGSVVVSKVICRMKAANTTQNVKVGLWSLVAGTGTQYGADSLNTLVAQHATIYTDYTFTWSVNPTVTGDFFMVFTPALGSAEIDIRTGTAIGTGNYYEDNTYAAYRGVNIIQSGDADLVFTLYKIA